MAPSLWKGEGRSPRGVTQVMRIQEKSDNRRENDRGDRGGVIIEG
jgi:hypothetical protein